MIPSFEPLRSCPAGSSTTVSYSIPATNGRIMALLCFVHLSKALNSTMFKLSCNPCGDSLSLDDRYKHPYSFLK